MQISNRLLNCYTSRLQVSKIGRPKMYYFIFTIDFLSRLFLIFCSGSPIQYSVWTKKTVKTCISSLVIIIETRLFT